jgi:hypothetical protein
MIQTEYEFTLPFGYPDEAGTLHRTGTMRLATAADEILPLKDWRVQANQAYLVVILLSRVIQRLGNLQAPLSTAVVEKLYAGDLAYLQEFYNKINRNGRAVLPAVCPHCAHEFEVEMNAPGGSVATP